MAKKQKLELTWVGKDKRPKLEPRILIEDPSKSYHAKEKRSENDLFDNMLIHGDNLLALKALEQEYAGKVKCVVIDPPYNTGAAFANYEDGIEHSIWLSLMKERISLLRSLMREDGSIWITIDDNEAHYLKVICDEIFGRKNFVANVIWEKADSPRMDARYFSSRHDHILVFAKNIDLFSINRAAEQELKPPSHYNKVDENGTPYYLKPLRAMGADGTREARPSMYYALTAPDGTEVFPKNTDGSDSRWRWSPKRAAEMENIIEWVKGRSGWSAYYRVFFKGDEVPPPETIWIHTEVGSNRTSKAEVKKLALGLTPFETPKPEKLIAKILRLGSAQGDLVLDSFAGSGTTGAVAHKMGRRWIMVELGEHCDTHCRPRLQKVIDGDDPGGVTEAVDWKGGGGFRYFELAPSLLEQDKYGNWVISKEYKPEMLAEAMCKHMGFTYAPSDDPEEYWRHGHSTETDFIYVTTQNLTHAALAKIADDVGPDRSLLICCRAFNADADAFENLTITKIPQSILRKCEWGRDDYSLNVENLPMAADEDDDDGADMPLFADRDASKGAGE